MWIFSGGSNGSFLLLNHKTVYFLESRYLGDGEVHSRFDISFAGQRIKSEDATEHLLNKRHTSPSQETPSSSQSHLHSFRSFQGTLIDLVSALR